MLNQLHMEQQESEERIFTKEMGTANITLCLHVVRIAVSRLPALLNLLVYNQVRVRVSLDLLDP
jgi:hypothetical protein